jgi:Na+/H+-dicarboxylate symporter
MEGADKRLGVPTEVGSFVLPLAVSAFKVNRTISSPLKLLFLAHVYGITLDPGTVALFIPTVMLLSFSSPGIPSGGFLVTMPFYLAAGIPVEGIVLLKAVDAVPDIFKTLVNVTADMSVATIVARFVGMPAGAAAPAVLVPMPADVVGATPAAP